MEYLIGSLVTATSIFLIKLFLSKNLKVTKANRLVIRQSRSYFLLRDYYLAIPREENVLKTQATDYFDRNHVRVVLIDDMAYWIKNNTLLCADIIDGIVDESSTKVVDTMALNDVELNKMILVVDKLTEGTRNDSWNSGDSQF